MKKEELIIELNKISEKIRQKESEKKTKEYITDDNKKNFVRAIDELNKKIDKSIENMVNGACLSMAVFCGAILSMVLNFPILATILCFSEVVGYLGFVGYRISKNKKIKNEIENLKSGYIEIKNTDELDNEIKALKEERMRIYNELKKLNAKKDVNTKKQTLDNLNNINITNKDEELTK